jgi:hypothetical protein
MMREAMMVSSHVGRAVVKARIENLCDLYEVGKGELARDEARTVEIDDAFVDADVHVLFVPHGMVKKLGLKIRRTAVRQGKGNMYDAVRLTIQGRECTIDVYDAPNDCPVLIGQIPLAMLDFVVDPHSQKLIGNFEHGGEHMIDAF